MDVSDFLYSTCVLEDLPVGVFGVLMLGAECFLVICAEFLTVRPSIESWSGRVNDDLTFLGLLGVELLSPSGIGEFLPLLALLDARVLLPLFNSGEVLPLMDEALLSTGEAVPAKDGSLVSDVLLLAGDTLVLRMGDSLPISSCSGCMGTGSTLPLRPWVTRRTWQGS